MTELDPETTIYIVSAGVSVACAVWLVADSLVRAQDEALRARAARSGSASALFRLLRPFAQWFGFLVGGMAARIEMRLGRDAGKSFLLSARVRIGKKLRAAGHPEGVTPDEFIGLMVVGAVFGALVGFVVFLRMQVLIVVFIGALLGSLWPQSWLAKALKRRQTAIRNELPYALDLLTLSVEAGLDFTEALRRISEKLGASPLASDLGRTLRDINLGRTRRQALRGWAERVDMAEINSIVSALIQADELGSSLGPILRIQSEQLRTTRSQEAEKKALQAPVKILFPLIFFIFPTIFLMIGGPIVLKYAFK